MNRVNVIIKTVDTKVTDVSVYENAEKARNEMHSQVNAVLEYFKRNHTRIVNAIYGDSLNYATLETDDNIYSWSLMIDERVY